jgi:peptide deformylase
MTAEEKIRAADLPSLQVVHYPDPRLKEICTGIEGVDDSVRALIDRMFELMFASNGVGLAAPQVGVTVRLFVASPTFQQEDRRVYINPRIITTDGGQEGEEGCLSFPGIFCKVKRARSVTVEALDYHGEPFTETVEQLHARIIQHEGDHLDGVLLADRMGSVAKLANRKALTALESSYTG